MIDYRFEGQASPEVDKHPNPAWRHEATVHLSLIFSRFLTRSIRLGSVVYLDEKSRQETGNIVVRIIPRMQGCLAISLHDTLSSFVTLKGTAATWP